MKVCLNWYSARNISQFKVCKIVFRTYPRIVPAILSHNILYSFLFLHECQNRFFFFEQNQMRLTSCIEKRESKDKEFTYRKIIEFNASTFYFRFSQLYYRLMRYTTERFRLLETGLRSARNFYQH